MKKRVKFVMIIMFYSCLFLQAQNYSEKLAPIIEKYVNYWNTGEFDGIEEILHNDFEMRVTPSFTPKAGIEHFKKSILHIRKTYPDFNIVLDEVLYDKDKAAAIWTIRGTHLGEGDLPPTGKKLQVSGISIVHFVAGKIKDEWISNNDLSWLKQLGYKIVPPTSE